MRGPHNIWRLIRTGATLERTGAMGVVLDAFDAPAHLRLTARILGWPVKWLGLTGDLNPNNSNQQCSFAKSLHRSHANCLNSISS